jgi:SPP1 gp7 family putative phage head morphogenesis protein
MARKRTPPNPRNAAYYTRRVTTRYATTLRKIARHVGEFAKHVIWDDPGTVAAFDNLMNGYARTITPWARAQGMRMAGQVDERDKQYWQEYAKDMGTALREQILTSPTGQVFRESVERQVGLITSLPIEAAQRVQELSVRGVSSGMRAEEISARIMETGEVTKSRANLIARTEVSRAQTEFHKARAVRLGSTQYVWRTIGDGRVRDSHREMEGTTHSWSNPPAPEGKQKYHPGCFPNCRCWAEAILPEEDFGDGQGSNV